MLATPEKLKPCNCCQGRCEADKALWPTQEDDPSQRILVRGKYAGEILDVTELPDSVLSPGDLTCEYWQGILKGLLYHNKKERHWNPVPLGSLVFP